MSYRISDYTKKQAKKLGVEVKPSKVKGKKIAVYKDGDKIADVGASGYADYPTYMKLEKQGKVAKGTAEARRKNYKARHASDRNVKGSRGFLADRLLW